MKIIKKIVKKLISNIKQVFNLLIINIDRESITKTYLKGTGIEIGALFNPLKLPKNVSVKYIDRFSVEDLRKQYPELKSENLVPVDIIDDGEFLGKLNNSSQDFVIANHFLEHTQNPILAIKNMFRVLKTGGILYLALPE